MRLSTLLQGEPALPAGFDPPVRGLSADSRALGDGDAFVALAGATTHGLRHLAQARAANVAAILFEPPAPDGTALPGNAIAVPRLRARQGELADRFHGAPSHALAVAGVTDRP